MRRLCRVLREGDENTCTCGLRWDINEPDPHDPKRVGRETLDELKEVLSDGSN